MRSWSYWLARRSFEYGMQSEYSFPSLSYVARTALPHHSPRYATNQAIERIEVYSFCVQTATAPPAHRSATYCFVWRTKSSLPPLTNLRSHSRRPTPGYLHILFTTVPQFTGLHVRKTQHYIYHTYTRWLALQNSISYCTKRPWEKCGSKRSAKIMAKNWDTVWWAPPALTRHTKINKFRYLLSSCRQYHYITNCSQLLQEIYTPALNSVKYGPSNPTRLCPAT